ncbi:alpha/beta fold hydrolase [Aestuariibacter sp. AA17]|uniref:Alpha/beta fold hydrolase n=1 Tax=Fluctibacter corallii TaxID=2984329 RepID=A0ABT3A6W1_9ALTE|nr:alpha/beta fold hydrolase [Aestuariibacter sp. AA17]MCV2884393.1 alpha/beta fold hydrolase [Aestuariibacter sp. AA17]
MEMLAPIADKMTEDEIIERYDNIIQPFWLETVKTGMFVGLREAEIHYAYVTHPAARGAVAISSGRIESLIKYKEVVYDLYQAGYSVFIHDHRGQGLSSRLTTNPHQGYVDSFKDYVDDFNVFYERVISPNTTIKPMLLCHSMGSAIGALYLLAHPQNFSRVVFCAPMFGIRPALPHWVAKTLIRSHLTLNKMLSSDPWYFWGQGDYQEHDFVTNVLTHSESRYCIFRDEYRENPNVFLGGVTGIWLREAVHAMNAVKRDAHRLKLPVLLLQAGADKVVDNRAQLQVANSLPHCQLVKVENARHEILMESEQYRAPTLKRILSFLAE